MSGPSCQQFQLYAAENGACRGRTFSSIDEVQAFYDAIRETPYWERTCPQVKRVEAYAMPENKPASVGSWDPTNNAGVCELLPVHWNEREALHEVAHVVTSARYGRNGHGPWFARTYLELVATVMGTNAYAELHRAFEQAGIDHEHDSYVPAGIQL